LVGVSNTELVQDRLVAIETQYLEDTLMETVRTVTSLVEQFQMNLSRTR
jgi:hypothetical protein